MVKFRKKEKKKSSIFYLSHNRHSNTLSTFSFQIDDEKPMENKYCMVYYDFEFLTFFQYKMRCYSICFQNKQSWVTGGDYQFSFTRHLQKSVTWHIWF